MRRGGANGVLAVRRYGHLFRTRMFLTSIRRHNPLPSASTTSSASARASMWTTWKHIEASTIADTHATDSDIGCGLNSPADKKSTLGSQKTSTRWTRYYDVWDQLRHLMQTLRSPRSQSDFGELAEGAKDMQSGLAAASTLGQRLHKQNPCLLNLRDLTL